MRTCVPKRAALHVKAFFLFPSVVAGSRGYFCPDDFTPFVLPSVYYYIWFYFLHFLPSSQDVVDELVVVKIDFVGKSVIYNRKCLLFFVRIKFCVPVTCLHVYFNIFIGKP